MAGTIRALRGLAAYACAAAVLTAASSGAAQQATRTYAIPPQALSDALRAYALASGVNVLAPTETVGQRRSRGAQGQLSDEQALRSILDGTGLVAEPSGSGAYVVRRAARASAAAGASTAAEPPMESDEVATAQLDEVIVTAQRREERMQSVPIAVTALSAAELDRRQVDNAADLARIAPAVTMAPSTSSELFVGIRGLVPTSLEATSDSAVGVYIDGVYVARAAGSAGALVDLERAEVLRGPQGTLFGRNTIGGALNLTTRKPGDRFEGYVSGGIGNYDRLEATGAINIPLVEDKMAVRIAARHLEHGGYGYSTTLGERLGEAKENYVRASLRVAPEPSWTLTLVADYYRNEGKLGFFRTSYFAPPASGNVVPAANGDSIANYLGGDIWTTGSGLNPDQHLENASVAADITVDLGFATLKSISAYRTIDVQRAQDLDGTPYAVLDLVNWPTHGWQISEELQLYGSSFDDRLDWIGGVFLFGERNSTTIQTAGNFPSTPFITRNVLQGAINKSYSVFGQLTYTVLPGLRITGGARWVRDERSVEAYIQDRVNPFTGALQCVIAADVPRINGECAYRPGGASFSYVPWLVSVDYQATPQVLVYAKASRGFRSGGFPPQGGANLATFAPFDPESIITYETGFKGDLLDRRLRVNLSLYHSDFKDIQQTRVTINPATGFQFNLTANVGKARINGGEAEVTAVLGDLTLSGAVGVIDGKFVAGPAVGTPLLVTSKYTTALEANYRRDVGVGVLRLHAGYAWRSRFWFYNPGGFSPARAASVSQKGYSLVDASAALEMGDITLTAWGENLTNEAYRARTQNNTGSGYNVENPGPPRTYGLRIGYRF